MASNGKIIGYVRVSSYDQNPERQLEGISLDKKFVDHISGKSIQRPQLEKLLDYVRDGDEVIVHSMDRLARNLDDLRHLVKSLTQRDVVLRFMKENLVFKGDDSPMSNLLLSIMGAFAEFERALIKERQLEGIAIAKQKGKYRGRKPSLNQEQVTTLKQRALSGEQKTKLAKDFGISRETLYQYLKNSS
ncbi:recombinase family protein [Fluoribacter gormanii]|uniref:recombinase family protein n=1 Tax=Fluoribacter gormanii TaxID=464 RepID=UPI0010415269|nr:recombinase family protein [Fluoribacter gormanii]